MNTKFTTWKTIKLGTGLKTAGNFIDALIDSGCFVTSWSHSFIRGFSFHGWDRGTGDSFMHGVAQHEIEVGLVKISTLELGFKEGANFKSICARAKELHLGVCPTEVGPQLRLQYRDQPRGELLMIAMDPVYSSGYATVFCVMGSIRCECDSGYAQGLDGCDGPNGWWCPEDQWIFLR